MSGDDGTLNDSTLEIDAVTAEAAAEADLVDGRYEIEAEMDRGTFGLVYRARDVWLERPACVKTIAPEFLSDESTRRRFKREAAALAAVRSENVVQVYSFGPHMEGFFLAMEYVRGKSLQALLDEHERHGARVPLVRALSILRQVTEGVAAVHRAGVVHRDLKPSNIVIEELTGRPVVVDFGLAVKANDVRLGMSWNAVIGTPEYMAPEQIDPDGLGPPTFATDVYGLGCTAYEMFTGHMPFEDNNPIKLLERQMRELPKAPSSFSAELAPLDPILARALAKRPSDRFANADELSRALAAVSRRVMPPLPEPIEDLDGMSVAFRISAVSDPGEDAAPAARRIVLVDDDAEFRTNAAHAAQLACFGVTVRIKSLRSGAHAIRDIRDKLPDLVILSADMIEPDGVETLARIRDLANGRAAHVLVVGKSLGPDERWKFSILGVESFLEKPVDVVKLVEVIGETASRAGWLPKKRPTEEVAG
ncbi:MAG: protein kinase [Deltaproteobacteria bacterium]|nr:protein kinase [Deltaproteobacteria bacterium]